MKYSIQIVFIALSFVTSSAARATAITDPVPSNLSIIFNNLEWAWASPVAVIPIALVSRTGFRT